MLTFLGYLNLCLITFGGYVLSGGHLAALFQPILFLMVVVGSLSIFYASNNAPVIKRALNAIPKLLTTDAKAGDLLLVLEKVLMQLSKGELNAAEVEGIAHPLSSHVKAYLVESAQLTQLPGMTAEEFARMSVTGMQSRTTASMQIGNAYRNLAHVYVAVGIMGCVLGFIHAALIAAGSETMPLLSHSMVGVFYGIFIGWGLILPIGNAIKTKHELLHAQYQCIDLALAAQLRGLAPSVAIAAGRKALL